MVSVSSIAKLLSKLESLTVAHPAEVLCSIKEYIGVENFEEGMSPVTRVSGVQPSGIESNGTT